MPSPWLKIPLEDYEGHMNSAAVQQAGVLSELFAEALAWARPESVAVMGIAGGNGLDRVDRAVTRRVVGLDVNAEYLESVRRRYGSSGGLELHCVDLAQQRLAIEPVGLVHAALVFEHAGTELCLDNALSLVEPGGTLAVVLQLPAEQEHNVGASGFASMQTLKPHFSLVDARWLLQTLSQRGFQILHERQRPLPMGKGFWMGVFRKLEARPQE